MTVAKTKKTTQKKTAKKATKKPTAKKKAAKKKATSTTATKQKKRGPARSKAIKYDYVNVTVSQCKKCQSTDRGPYYKRQVFTVEGVNHATGQKYNMIVNRFCKCSACGQARIDKHFLNVSNLKQSLKRGRSPDSIADGANLKIKQKN